MKNYLLISSLALSASLIPYAAFADKFPVLTPDDVEHSGGTVKLKGKIVEHNGKIYEWTPADSSEYLSHLVPSPTPSIQEVKRVSDKPDARMCVTYQIKESDGYTFTKHLRLRSVRSDTFPTLLSNAYLKDTTEVLLKAHFNGPTTPVHYKGDEILWKAAISHFDHGVSYETLVDMLKTQEFVREEKGAIVYPRKQQAALPILLYAITGVKTFLLPLKQL